ncbi:hypothetical protein ABFS82_14G200900 [Erythranthe guttata]|uniref:non-specific lipid transfer protein-like 1 n=1 Tax=Erythranthe guttata TaxID=4155 RepID=UPI00064DAB78|nr:PREDICTED: non-specific lipid transfer protein-like 1 [Erythranthe guttata]|eukprot:XP_012833183.1 PREDICTED: non-specific lipid transfer protein-like 1 [Erythranthe guttata]
MAHSYLSATLVALIVLIISSVLLFGAKAQQIISTPCTSSVITTFTPCINYVTGSSGTASSPTKDCCDSLKSVMTNNMDCVCLIVTGNVPFSLPFLNANLAISLPRVCQNSVPLQCQASGIPLPAPGPVLFGPPQPRPRPPSPAPSPTHAHAPSPHSYSPKASKAVAAVAAPPPTGSLDIAPAAPPEFPEGRSENPWIRPVVNPNSASSSSTVSSPSLVVLTFIGVVAFKFLW